MDNEFDECEWERPSRPLRRIDLLIMGTTFARNMAEAITEALSSAEFLLCSHANHKVDQAVFAEQAALEIESMTTEE